MPVGHWIKAPWIDCEAHGGQKSFEFWVLGFEGSGRDSLLRDPGMHVSKFLFSFLLWPGYCAYSRLIDVRRRSASLPVRFKTQNGLPLLPFDSTRWLTGYIVADSVDAFYLVDDSRGDTRQDFVRNPDPVGCHPVLALHDTQSNTVFVSSLVTHHANGSHWQQNGE